MPPPSKHSSLRLSILPETFFVAQFQLHERLPDSLKTAAARLLDGDKGPFLSITRTDEEISVVGVSTLELSAFPATWKCIRIAGPMDFALTGIMCDLTTPLKEAAVPIFAISTWNTDYILVPEGKLKIAVHTLKKDGWVVQ